MKRKHEKVKLNVMLSDCKEKRREFFKGNLQMKKADPVQLLGSLSERKKKRILKIQS